MKNFFSQKKNVLILIIIGVAFFVLSGIINSSISSKEEEKAVDLSIRIEVPSDPELEESRKIIWGKITRSSRLNPNRTYYDTIFFEDEIAFAQCKSTDHKTYDCTQNIPDGLVEFVNKTKNTFGEEYYRNGKRDQSYKEYYSDGQLRRESLYFLGTMKTNKEYFSDGIVSKQEDFQDALWIPENKNRETGSGKVYFRDGRLMYEWHLTNQSQGGYTKSYDYNGRLVVVSYFDQNGDLIEDFFKSK